MVRVRKPPPPVVGRADILPTGIYRATWVKTALGLGYAGLAREVREGRLTMHVRCGKRFATGQDLLDWIRSGPAPEVRVREVVAAGEG